MEGDLQKLLKQKQEIEEKIQAHYRKFYNKYEEQKDTVTSENPYSRLFALKKMGIVQNYEQFSQQAILIVGNISFIILTKRSWRCGECLGRNVGEMRSGKTDSL
jgi:hypothetical protein